jgi:hypothetical protein
MLMDYRSEAYSRVNQLTEALVVLSHPKWGRRDRKRTHQSPPDWWTRAS